MACRITRWLIPFGGLFVLGILSVSMAQAELPYNGSTDLFYNFYVMPSGGSAVGAEMYPCPHPVPPVSLKTYVTYQPLMPHEFLYQHHKHYVNQSADGTTRTRVHWR
jgi:hypothetical protein